jgi:hypothetical protein
VKLIIGGAANRSILVKSEFIEFLFQFNSQTKSNR